MIDLTLNSFLIGNMASFQNDFGTKKDGTNPDGSPKGCNTLELTRNMMRPVTVTSNNETSQVEADAALNLSGAVTSLRLGAGVYQGVELKIFNGAADIVELLDSDYTIPIQPGDTLDLRWNGSDWRVKTSYFVGDFFEQKPAAQSPVVRRWEGNWVNWTYRSILYGISSTPPTGEFIQDWLQKRHDIWTLNTDGSVATQGTKKYTKPSDYTFIARESVVKLSDPDLTEGAQITSGPYAGKYVWQNVVPAGIFWSVEDSDPAYTGGGKRPT